MYSGFSRALVVLAVSVSALAWGQSAKPQSVPKNGGDFSNTIQPGAKVPKGVILVARVIP